MTRHVLIEEDGKGRTVPEAPLPAEANLHDALTKFPELVPAEDLGLGRAVVVGRESAVASGYADLVLLDDRGQLCLVEVKKEGNPDTRRVVAQLLDYAAALWGKTLSEFERLVLLPYLRETDPERSADSLSAFLAEAFGPDPDEETSEAGADIGARIERGLEQALATGDMRLVVAAPHIPEAVQRVLEYLNARGLRMYGLEVSYFSGPVKCFVPRLVVRPTLADDPGPGPGPRPPMSRESFLAAVGVHSDLISDMLDALVGAGARVQWKSWGPAATIARHGRPRQVVQLDPTHIYVVVRPPSGLPEEPFTAASQQLEEAGAGSRGERGYYWTVRLADATKEQLEAVRDVVVALCTQLAVRIPMTALAEPVSLDFERNDNNIWQKQVLALAAYHGRRLRGRLRRISTGASGEVELLPLAGGQPGWRPDVPDRAALWPPEWSKGERYSLEVTAVEAMHQDPPG